MARTKVSWTAAALKAYRDTGEELKAEGYRPFRDIPDPDRGTQLTFWGNGRILIIQQTWTDSGDVCLFREMSNVTDAVKSEMKA